MRSYCAVAALSYLLSGTAAQAGWEFWKNGMDWEGEKYSRKIEKEHLTGTFKSLEFESTHPNSEGKCVRTSEKKESGEKFEGPQVSAAEQRHCTPWRIAEELNADGVDCVAWELLLRAPFKEDGREEKISLVIQDDCFCSRLESILESDDDTLTRTERRSFCRAGEWMEMLMEPARRVKFRMLESVLEDSPDKEEAVRASNPSYFDTVTLPGPRN